MSTQMLTSNQGAELISFKVNGEERLHQGESIRDEKGKVYWERQWELMFPIVGKCKKNQTIINGKTYEMPIDGFLKDAEFEPISKLDNFHSYRYQTNKKLIDKFPYDFSLIVTYRTDENKLTTIYKVTNDGNTDIPFGIGSKPAFKIDVKELEKGNYYLEFDENEEKIHFLYLVDGLVGTEYARNIMSTKKIIPLGINTFMNDAIIIRGIKNKKVALKKRGEDKPLLKMYFDGFPYLTLWSKPKAPFLCICPCMTLADNVNGSGVFRQKSDILLLPSKQEFECKYTVEFF